MLFSFGLFILCWSHFGWARTPKMIPLMPPPERGGILNELRIRPQDSVKPQKQTTSPSLELGALATPNSNTSNFLGMQVLLGGRLSFNFSVFDESFFLKPSLGYFMSRQSSPVVNSLQQIYESGLTAQFSCFKNQSIQSFVGVANRLDYIVDISKTQTQTNTGNRFRYRVGPSVGLQVQLMTGLQLVSQFEYTFSFSQPINSFGVLTTGLAFEL